MYSLCILTVTACLLSLLLTPLARNWSVRLGLVDRPDHKRKMHPGPVPRTGGVPIILSYLGAYALLLLLPLKAGGVITQHLGMFWRLLPPVALVFFTGLLDDWLGLRPWQKLLGQVAAAAWACSAGVRIVGVAGHATEPWSGFLLTVGWLVLCSNAFNLIDGIDGLATGVGLAATATTLIAGVVHGDVMLVLATAPLAGCLVGFLRYNFNPASIFLGDSGSLLIGFLLGAYGVIWGQKSATMVGMAAPAMAMALPLLEVCLSVARRFLSNEPIFNGDRRHIHHLLLDRGFTPCRVALLLYAACGVGAALSLLPSFMRNRLAGLVIVLFGAVIFLGIRYLGYVEFDATRRFLWAGFRPMLRAQVKLQLLERSLASAASVQQCWDALLGAALSLGYSHVNACLGGRRFSSSRDRPPARAFWQMRLNLSETEYVNITQCRGSAEQPAAMIPFIEVVRRVLPGRLAQLGATGALPDSVTASLFTLAAEVESRSARQAAPRNSSTSTVMSSDCGAPSVNAATAS